MSTTAPPSPPGGSKQKFHEPESFRIRAWQMRSGNGLQFSLTLRNSLLGKPENR